jgi:hypothetical protein
VDDIFSEPMALAVAIFVALAVVAAAMTPCFFLFRSRNIWALASTVASLFAITAVILGLKMFTFWALYDGGHGHPLSKAPLDQWGGFMAINAILAAGAGIPGGIVGAILGHLICRRGLARGGVGV